MIKVSRGIHFTLFFLFLATNAFASDLQTFSIKEFEGEKFNIQVKVKIDDPIDLKINLAEAYKTFLTGVEIIIQETNDMPKKGTKEEALIILKTRKLLEQKIIPEIPKDSIKKIEVNIYGPIEGFFSQFEIVFLLAFLWIPPIIDFSIACSFYRNLNSLKLLFLFHTISFYPILLLWIICPFAIFGFLPGIDSIIFHLETFFGRLSFFNWFIILGLFPSGIFFISLKGLIISRLFSFSQAPGALISPPQKVSGFLPAIFGTIISAYLTFLPMYYLHGI